MLEQAKIQEIAERTLSKINDGNAEINFSQIHQQYTRFAENSITQPTEKSIVNINLRYLIGNKQANVKINQFSEEAIHHALKKAKILSNASTEEPNLLKILSQKQQYHETSANYDETDLSPVKQTQAAGKIIEKGKKHQLRTAGNCITNFVATGYANSHGLFAFNKSAQSTISTTMQTKNSAGWGFQLAQRFDELNVDKISETALTKALSSQNPTELDLNARKTFPVILEPAAVADLLLYLSWQGFNAQSFLEGRSYASGNLNSQYFDEKLSICDDAYNNFMPGIPFDYEGSARQKIQLIEAGKPINVVHDRTTAKKGNVQSTGHSHAQASSIGPIPANLIVKPGTKSMEEIIAETDFAVLLTSLHYINVENPRELKLTGLTRNGTFLVENGKITKPLINMRFTESLLNCLKPGGIDAISNQEVICKTFFGTSASIVPGMKLKSFTFTSHTGF